jgi:hypothetical protein
LTVGAKSIEVVGWHPNSWNSSESEGDSLLKLGSINLRSRAEGGLIRVVKGCNEAGVE